MFQHRHRSDLDHADNGWLKARFHFTIRPEGVPEHTALGPLIVWNDDEVAPGNGFPMHRHQDVEIISFIRQGAVTHADSEGGQGRVSAGDVQVISAGRGIRHEEFNREDTPLRLFQIWLRSNERGAEPRWESKPFPRAHRMGQLVTLASGLPGDPDAVPIRARARVMAATLKAGQTVHHRFQANAKAYLVPASGTLRINREEVGTGDGLAMEDVSDIVVEATADAEVVMVEVM